MTAGQQELPAMVTPEQLGEYLQVPVETLKYWRYHRRGPRWTKVEGLVRYRRRDVEQYLAAHTTETAGAAR